MRSRTVGPLAVAMLLSACTQSVGERAEAVGSSQSAQKCTDCDGHASSNIGGESGTTIATEVGFAGGLYDAWHTDSVDDVENVIVKGAPRDKKTKVVVTFGDPEVATDVGDGVAGGGVNSRLVDGFRKECFEKADASKEERWAYCRDLPTNATGRQMCWSATLLSPDEFRNMCRRLFWR